MARKRVKKQVGGVMPGVGAAGVGAAGVGGNLAGVQRPLAGARPMIKKGGKIKAKHGGKVKKK